MSQASGGRRGIPRRRRRDELSARLGKLDSESCPARAALGTRRPQRASTRKADSESRTRKAGLGKLDSDSRTRKAGLEKLAPGLDTNSDSCRGGAHGLAIGVLEACIVMSASFHCPDGHTASPSYPPSPLIALSPNPPPLLMHPRIRGSANPRTAGGRIRESAATVNVRPQGALGPRIRASATGLSESDCRGNRPFRIRLPGPRWARAALPPQRGALRRTMKRERERLFRVPQRLFRVPQRRALRVPTAAALPPHARDGRLRAPRSREAVA